ncbi:hypothetical protein OJAV_G00034710 [Oryzias javanicus]|uniref:Uncharacterized protein n=1 Tax=Oryzias javanicus TaxID=123683 RepID=A0A437DGA8_ORYJA|nr:hypothetical protein OJAV_G00034710 [Oryzias javanicus]
MLFPRATAEIDVEMYQLRRRSPWRSLAVQWQTWLALITTIILMGALPYVVHCMMTAFPNNRSHITFKLAAGTFGFLSELLLIKGLSSWLVTRYHKALQTSFIIHPRIPDPQEKEKDADLRNGHLISF